MLFIRASILVSPLVIRPACHHVSAPNAANVATQISAAKTISRRFHSLMFVSAAFFAISANSSSLR